MKTLSLGPRWTWPRECACCLAPADTTLEVKKSVGTFLVVAAVERVLTLQVPYCRACRDHARRFEAGTLGALVKPAAMVLFAAVVVGMIGLAVKGGSSGQTEVRMLLVYPAIATVAFVAFRVFRRLSIQLPARHASAGPAVTIREWTGDTVDVMCANPTFTTHLEAANRRS
jgi:hypothetical protein